jgi:hypothetical protein
MYDEKVILAVSNYYEQKYYFNEDFDQLPTKVQEDLKIICVLFTSDVGGIFSVLFNEKGDLLLESSAHEEDILFDEIGAHLKIKQLQSKEEELWESLETFFKIFYLGEDI